MKIQFYLAQYILLLKQRLVHLDLYSLHLLVVKIRPIDFKLLKLHYYFDY